MRRLIALLTGAGMILLGLVATGPVQAKVPGPNGRIAFGRLPNATSEDHVTFTVNPDGSHLQQLLPEPAGIPHWSPDGSEVAVLACPNGEPCSATIVNPDTGTFRQVPEPDPEPTLFNEFFACVVWSPDSASLACEADGDTPGVSGIYTIRSSDGGDLTRITTAPVGGADAPGDYSPDGKRLVFGRSAVGDEQPVLFVVKLSGGAPKQITQSGMFVGGASWSPSGNNILFAAQPDADHRGAIFVVNADGSGLHQVPIPGCGGAFSNVRSIACFDPGWSPDGTKIVFARASAFFNVQNIYSVNADGSSLFQVTHGSSGLGVCCPNWGRHPLST